MLTIPQGCTSPRPLTSPHHQPPLHLISPSFTHRSQTRHLWPSHTCCINTRKVHGTHTCVCAPHTTAQTACSSPHLSPFPGQSTNAHAAPLHWKKGTNIFEHLLCAAQHTEPFTCAFFLKLFTSPKIYFTDSEPETQRDDPHHTMGGLPAWNGTSGSSPLSHPYFSAEEKSSKGQNLSAVGSDE